MGNFQGTLKSNEIFSAIYNMIISQQVFSDNIAGTNAQLVDAARVDGTLYGDTKLYYATDALKSIDWIQDSAEATNVLALHRPADPKCQAITIDKFRQIALTVDEYMSKRAFADEGAFGQFNSVMQGWIADTKRIYDSTTYNAFIGTAEGQTAGQSKEIVLTGLSDEARAKKMAQEFADLFVDMTDVSRDFNDYGYLRSYDLSAIKVIWNKKYINEIRKIDLPTIFHKDGLMDKFDEYALPARYFGKINASPTAGDGVKVRSLIEQEITKSNETKHVFAGDLIPTGFTAPANTSYTVDDYIIAKVVVELPPYMSAFETGTSFYNSRNLSTNHYLTFGRNTLEYLKNYPMITVTEQHS